MKFLILILMMPMMAYAGRLQNSDFATLAELTARGASATSLLNDDKVYVTANGLNKQLSQAIADGTIASATTPQLIFENWVTNPFFETSPTTNWTTSGTSVVSGSYAFPTTLNKFYSQITSTVNGGYFQSNTVSAPSIAASSTISTNFAYQVTSGTWVASIFYNNVVVASQTLTSGNVFLSSLPMFYGVSDTAGNNIFLRFTAAASASTLRLDSVFMGRAMRGLVTSTGNFLERTERATIAACATSPCTIQRQSGAITSVTRSATGDYLVNFAAGTFSDLPFCQVEGYRAGASLPITAWQTLSLTQGQAQVANDAGILTDATQPWSVYCYGPR